MEFMPVEDNNDKTSSESEMLVKKTEMKRKRSGSPLLSSSPPTKYRQIAVSNELQSFISLDELCDELLFEIFKSLDTWSLLSLQACNRRFQALTMDHRFWSDIDLIKTQMPLGLLEEIMSNSNEKTQCLKLRGNPISEQHELEVESFSQTLSQVLIVKCKNLTVLELDSVALDFRIFFINDLPSSLKRLVFRNCHQHECNSMNTFSGMENHFINLEEFGSEYNSWFKPYYVMALSKLPKLRKLSLRGCALIQSFVPYGSLAARLGFKSLESLDFRNTPINDSDLQCFNALEKLKVLLLEQVNDVFSGGTSSSVVKCIKNSPSCDETLNIEHIASDLRRDYARRLENSRSKSTEDKQKIKPSSTVDLPDHLKSSLMNSVKYDNVIITSLSGISATTNGQNIINTNNIAANTTNNNNVDTDNQPSTSRMQISISNLNGINKNPLNDDDDTEDDTDDDDDDTDDGDDDFESNRPEILSPAWKSQLKQLEDRLNKGSKALRRQLNLCERMRLKRAKLNNRQDNNLVVSNRSSPRVANNPGNVVVVRDPRREQRRSKREAINNYINHMMVHPLFWSVVNPCGPPAIKAPHDNNNDNALSVSVCAPPRSQHMPERGYISDRGVCSFGRPENPADRGMIWIRVAARPVDNSLERIILRNYPGISDTSLRHLVQCSPNLVYLDVSGTSITLEGVRAFSAQKPTCNIVAHHLLGWPSTNQLEPDF